MSDDKTQSTDPEELLPTDDMEEIFDDPGETGSTSEQVAPEDELAGALQELDEFRDRYHRSLADQENARKRHQREMQDARRYGVSELSKELLEVADNLDRALDGASSDEPEHPMIAGVRMVRDELRRALCNHGVEEIEAVGQPFDPMLHNAIMQEDRDDLEPGTVTEEFAKGYKIADRLLRASMVKVAKKPAGSSSDPTSSEDATDDTDAR